MLTVLYLVAALVVLWRTLAVIAILDARAFRGQLWRFVGIACHYALIGAGAVAVILGVPAGGPLLLGGTALACIADRRWHR
nr:hypothetical protein [Dechloromonas sp.]